MCLIGDTSSYNMYMVGYVQQLPFFHNIHHYLFYLDTVNAGNIWNPISQVRKLFGTYHLLCLIGDTFSYNVYMVGYVQQLPVFHNIHHPLSYPNTVNIGNIWNPISQVLKLFRIYHLLGLMRDILGYNLYMLEYLQHVPFSYNIRHPIQTLLTEWIFKARYLKFQNYFPYTIYWV